MPVGYEAFAHFADAHRPNAVLKLTEVRGSGGTEGELRAYARGFKRFVAYFRPAENRAVAEAFAVSMRDRFGQEVADSALERSGFHRFEIHGKPLHTRRVRAVFEVAQKEQANIRAENRALRKSFTDMTCPETAYSLRTWIAGRSSQRHYGQDINLDCIARQAQYELEKLGADGTRRLTATDVRAVVDQILRDQSQSPETESDQLSRASGPRWADASQHTEPGANGRSRPPSIDMPLDLESHVSEERIPVTEERIPVSEERTHVSEENPYTEIRVAPAEQEPPPGTRRAAVKSGAAIDEPVLDSLYQRVQVQLNDLACELTEKQIRMAVGEIQFAIMRTLFEAQQPPGPPPPGPYHRNARKTCWEYLVARCKQKNMPNVAENIDAYDRARKESLYRSIQRDLGKVITPLDHPGALDSSAEELELLRGSAEALESPSVSSEGLELLHRNGEDFNRQQALLRICDNIVKEIGHARHPEPLSERVLQAYWQSMLARHGTDSTEAIASLLASPASAVRRVTETANSFVSDWPDSQEAQDIISTGVWGEEDDWGPGNWDREGVCYGSVEWMAAKTWLDFMNGLVGAIPNVSTRVGVPPFGEMRSEYLSSEERAMLINLGVPVPEQRLRTPAMEEPRQDDSAVAGRRLPREVSRAVESAAESTPRNRWHSVPELGSESQAPEGGNAGAVSGSSSSVH